MKKCALILLSILMLFIGTGFSSFAKTLDEASVDYSPTSQNFTLWIDVLPIKGPMFQTDLKAQLLTDSEEVIEGSIFIESPQTVKIEFHVGEYKIGTKFNICITDGIDKIYYYDKTLSLGESFVCETYAYTDDSGNPVIHDCAHISVLPLKEPWDVTAEKFVNERNIQSDTDYLIWVSKKNYTVSVYLNRDYGWDCIKQISCSIGAPNTPTVTGEFVYHQYQNRWQYNGYYVGPIMRFYNGYAIHSTLVNDNGTHRDARLGKMISHGCVRVLPEDARWLTDYIPLGTKIYVTEE